MITKSDRIKIGLAILYLGSIVATTFVLELKLPGYSVLVSFSSALCLIILILLWSELPKKFRNQKSLYERIGADTEFGAKTLLGWIANGRDYVAVSEPNRRVRKIRANQISKIYWGDPSGRISQDEPGSPPEAYYDLFESDSFGYWIAVETKEDITNNILVSFSKIADRDQWLGFIRSLKYPALAFNCEAMRKPSSKDWLRWGINRELLYYTLGAIYLLDIVLLFPGHTLVRIVLRIAFFATMFPIASNIPKLKVRMNKLRWERYLAGYQGDLKGPLATELLKNTLFLSPLPMLDPSQGSIELDEVSKVDLVTHQPPWNQRNFRDLFKKNVPNSNSEIQFKFHGDIRSPLKISLPNEQAKALYEQIQSKLDSKTA